MLTSLHIQNYALIDTLDMDFEHGFSVITGETGAGKSIILGALGLLLGQRADSKSIKSGASRCVIEAHFDLSDYEMNIFFEKNDIDYDDECILRRELLISGKSRAFINDTPVPLNLMKELGEHLIDIHSQHQNLLLGKENFQLEVVDIIAGDAKELAEYQRQYEHYRQLAAELEKLKNEAEKNRADEEFLVFQLEQLEQLNIQDGEQENLELEVERLTHAEEIKGCLYAALYNLSTDEGHCVLNGLKETGRQLQGISRVYLQAERLQERIQSCYIELKDIAGEIESALEDVEFNPERLAWVNDRLNAIYTLEQKHRVNTGEELISLKKELQERLENITSYDERIDLLTSQKQEAYRLSLEKAAILTELRKEAAVKIEKELCSHLIPLGMPNVQFVIDIQSRKEPDTEGMDSIRFLFSANKNGNLQEIAHVASGGEIARVMLSIKALITGSVKLPTIIFDEIDTGVSGKIAERMAYIMQEMGDANRQVISITHLPQIAARGKTHYRVYKEESEEGTTSHLIRLQEEERITEIAHMLSGEVLTEAAKENARELLKI